MTSRILCNHNCCIVCITVHRGGLHILLSFEKYITKQTVSRMLSVYNTVPMIYDQLMQNWNNIFQKTFQFFSVACPNEPNAFLEVHFNYCIMTRVFPLELRENKVCPQQQSETTDWL